MPDISMCEGKDCPLKDKCYRFIATPDKYHQSYFTEPPYENDKCEYFISIERKVK